MTLLEVLNPENVTLQEVAGYSVREAARAVVIDSEGKVAMLYASKANYYKLPGGGIEEGEDPLTALHRECHEEIGCAVEVTQELGIIEEYRKFEQLKQISYCYVASLKGEKGTPEFTPEELAEGFSQLWIPYQEALALISKNEATDLEGSAYIVPRDSIFLKTASPYLLSMEKFL
jgi:8-oxo-dGTP diphosphatase